MRLLLVEDDTMIAESTRDALRIAGYTVDWASTGREAELSLANGVYDLVVLDLGLPGKDGIRVLEAYRQGGGLSPVLIVTARDSVSERIRGLDAGADDYLIKPFDIDELSARVRALLRRRVGHATRVYAHGTLSLDPAAHEAILAGHVLDLVPREFSLLQALIEEPARVFSKSELEDKLYGWGQEIGSNAIEVYVHSLRRKLGADQIVTIRGVGYRLAKAK